jgi:branched-chain amino acid aminotransferase/4-amino-4-deoxychorismate lyase
MYAPADFAPWMGVFETLRVINGVPLFAAEHREELARAMAALGLSSETDFTREDEEHRLSGRLRWIVTKEKTIRFFREELAAPVAPVALSVSSVRVGACNWDARFKTLSYLSHMQSWMVASTPEAILLNEHGHVTSAGRGNIFWRRGDRVLTPAHEAGCRCGVVRGFVLGRVPVEIGHFSVNELLEADEIFMTNSMRGIISINEMEGRPLTGFSMADQLREEYEKAVAAQLQEV